MNESLQLYMSWLELMSILKFMNQWQISSQEVETEIKLTQMKYYSKVTKKLIHFEDFLELWWCTHKRQFS